MGAYNQLKVLENVIWVGTNHLEMIIGTYARKKQSHGLDKKTDFATSMAKLAFLGKNGPFVETVT